MTDTALDKKILILYHGDCPDGFGAAWAAWKKFGNEAEYVPLNHQDVPLENISGREVYFLDFSYSGDVIKNIVSKNIFVTIIDHHASREEDIKSATKYIFDNNHSGAVLSWNFFHPGEKLPRILEYIEDRDLGNWRLDRGEVVCASLDRFPTDFTNWEKLAEELESDEGFQKHVIAGQAVMDYENIVIERIIKSSKVLVEFEGHQCYCVNAPAYFASTIGYKLMEERFPLVIIWSYNGKGLKVSLRSSKDNDAVDVAEIAEKYGGGGHRQAAAFTLKEEINFPWKKVNNG